MKLESSKSNLHRVVSVLMCFSPDALELGASDISRMIEMPKSTAFRIFTHLTEEGLVERNWKTSKYRVGPALYELGILYLSSTDIVKASELVIKTLNELTNEAVNVGIFDKGNVILIMKEESKYAFRLAVHIGSILQAYASSIGKAFLSELADVELDSLYPGDRMKPVTKETVATKAKLKRQLEQVRKTRVAIAKGEYYEGVGGIASLIRDESGSAVAGMSITVPLFRLEKDDCERLATLVIMGVNLISYRLGYRDQVSPVRDIQAIRSWWEQSKIK